MSQDMKERIKNKISECITIGLVLVLYIIIGKIVGVTCPFKYFTGISCAGCGMTRAWGALLQMDVRQAFHYHPLFWIPIVCLFAYIFKEKIPTKIYQLLWGIVVAIALIVYLYRLMDVSDVVVVFEPQESKIAKIWMWFQNNIK